MTRRNGTSSECHIAQKESGHQPSPLVNDFAQEDDHGEPSIIVSPMDHASEGNDGNEGSVFTDGEDRPYNEIKRLSAAFGGADVGGLPEEEDLDASQEPGSMGGITSEQGSASGGRVLQGSNF